MRAGAKTPWVLAAAAALLALYIAIFERKHETTDEARASRERLFAGLNRGDVTAIEIDRGTKGTGKGRVTLMRAGTSEKEDSWQVAPGDESAARGAVDELLDAIDGLEVDRLATATAADAGLEPPVARLVLTTPARRFALDTGSLDTSGRGVFVRREGDRRIFVVARRLRDLVDRDAGAFRDRGLFTAADVTRATALSFQSGTDAPQTLRRRAGLWLDEQGTFATRASVADALRMLAALQASGFPSGARADGGAAPAPRRTVVVSGEDGGSEHLEVWTESCATDGGAGGERAAFTRAGHERRDAGKAICVDGGAVDRLWRELEAANRRDPHLLLVDPAGVYDIALADGERRLRMRRDDDGGWHFVEPAESYGADAKVVGDWLAKLATTTTTVAPKKAAGTPPTGAASVEARKLVVVGATRAEIEIGPPRGGQTSIVRTGESAPGRVGAEAFAALDPDLLRFRARAVLALPQFDVRALKIRGPRERVVLQREAGADWVRAGEGATPNASAVDRLLGILSDLRAAEFVTPAPPSFKAETIIDAEVRAGDAPPQHHRLELAAKCRARLQDTPVFMLPPKTCEDLERTIAAIH